MNKNRRNFLKGLIIISGAALVGKIFGSRVLNIFSSDSADPTIEKNFENFKISKNKKELIISDQNGEEIFIIDNEQ